MNNPIRKDRFSDTCLEGMYGPFQIIKDNKTTHMELLPKLSLYNRDLSDDSLIISDKLSKELDLWTSHGDIAYLDGRGGVRIALSHNANVNTLLVTEQCNNLCLFCSQPPKETNDEILYAYAAQSLISFNTDKIVGISGGEPFLHQLNVLNFFHALNIAECFTPLHILSNGRAFASLDFTKEIVACNNNRGILLGIPLYGSSSRTHDLLVNSAGAWNDTVSGIINAVNCGLAVELRIIPTKLNIHELVSTVKIILDCTDKLASISVMNLEHVGWANKNWDELYLPPSTYGRQLEEICQLQMIYQVPVRLFNYPLCHLETAQHVHAVKSISDWKNNYDKSCNVCSLRSDCGGFFVSQKIKLTTPIGDKNERC